MKKIALFLGLAITLAVACKKTTNNTTVVTSGQPPFILSGLSDIVLQNGNTIEHEEYLTFQYADSAQQTITLSLSQLPAGIVIDTTWVTTGLPTFTTSLIFYDTSAAGATPGKYPMVLTATYGNGSKKNYTFNITVKPQVSCTFIFVGKYNNCETFCGGGLYSDSVYADANVVNKVWFTNFENTGKSVYATYNCNTEALTMPAQTVGGVTYSGSGEAGSHFIEMEITSSTTGSCEMQME